MEGVDCVSGEYLLDMGNAEERNELSPVRFDCVGFEVGSGDGAIFEFNGHVVGDLDGVEDTIEPELHGEVMFSKVIASNSAEVFPVCFCEAVLILPFAWGTGGGGIIFIKEFFDDATDEFEVTIGKHFEREFSNSADELLELAEDCGVLKVFEAVNELYASFAIDDEESILDAADGCAATVADVIVEDVAEVVWSWNGGFVSIFLVHGGSFASGLDGITTNVADSDGVGNNWLELFHDGGNVAKTGAFLEVLSGD